VWALRLIDALPIRKQKLHATTISFATGGGGASYIQKAPLLLSFFITSRIVFVSVDAIQTAQLKY
jgi:hypothetical protein